MDTMNTPNPMSPAIGTGATSTDAAGTDGNDSTKASPRLISSSKVQGTEVYASTGEHVGEIDHLMIERASGRVAYAVMSFGGIFGMGKAFYPIPWNALKYDTTVDGYRTGITRAQVESAPAYTGGETFDWNDDEWHSRVHDHYRTPPTSLPYL